MKHIIPILTLTLLALPATAQPSTPAPAESPAHQELRDLRDKIIDSINRGDLETLLPHVHPNLVITWQTGEVCRGHQGLRDFYQRLGKNAFKGYKMPPTPDELTILHGENTGVSFGNSSGTYELLGKTFEFHNRWTATVVKEGGRWQLAGYHVSLNALDNPVLNTAKQSLAWVGGGAALAGVIVGLMFGRRRRSAV